MEDNPKQANSSRQTSFVYNMCYIGYTYSVDSYQSLFSFGTVLFNRSDFLKTKTKTKKSIEIKLCICILNSWRNGTKGIDEMGQTNIDQNEIIQNGKIPKITLSLFYSCH